MRKDFSIITQWVKDESYVVDLGCGDGELFNHLQDKKQVAGYGIENDHQQIYRCLERGVPVLQQNLEQWLKNQASKSVEYLILSNSIQTLSRPDSTMGEILRVGKKAIISFPNMAYWACRAQLFFWGRMPVSKALPAGWYETQNIHLCTITDFEKLCRQLSIRIIARQAVSGVPVLMNHCHNLCAESVLYLLDSYDDEDGASASIAES